jgi:hypothetical protein
MVALREVESREHGSAPVVVAHYFNWFKTPEIRGGWHNWEWKGEGPRHDPERFLEDGRRDIASVYYPLIGPYDSSDPDVIEYHMLSAKAAKIDAFFIDWYGIPSDEEKGFPGLLEQARSLGFKMCICFEDKAMFGYCYDPPSREAAVDLAVSNLVYILEHHAQDPAYLKIDGLPLVVNFSWSEPGDGVERGDDGFSAQEWLTILERVRRRHDLYFVHDYHCHMKEQYWAVADNMYPWLDVNGACLDAFHERMKREVRDGTYAFASTLVYPGFDNTGVWGWGDGPFVTPREDGAFYERSWRRALALEPRLVQVATWNDFGEGATIEPAREYGFKYLEMTEKFAARLKGVASGGVAGARTAHARFLARRRARLGSFSNTPPQTLSGRARKPTAFSD